MNNPPPPTSDLDISPSDIVVGVDDSNTSRDAVRWAAEEAALRDVAVVLVNVNTWQQFTSELWPMSALAPDEELVEYSQVVLEEAKAELISRSRVPVKTVPTIGAAAAELVKHIDHGAMGVVGRRGDGGFGGLPIGGVTSQVARHATPPVAVVPAGAKQGDECVVVGVDGSEHSPRVLSHAFEEASLRRLPLRVVHGWRNPKREPPRLRVATKPPGVEAALERALADLTAPVAEKYVGVPVEYHAVHRHPVRSLFEAAETAALLVVGSRGRGGFTGLLLGSVSEAVIRHTECPTLVVR